MPSTSDEAQPEDPLVGHPRYHKVRDLNSGTFGFVVLALDRWVGEHVAIKFLSRGDKVTKYVHREILNHRRLHHPHIIQMKEVFLTPKCLAIVMEFAPGGDMYQHVLTRRGLLESDARWFFQQLVIALDYCHKMGVANRDIKLENTLLDDSPRPLIKLCDFGYSKHEKYQSAPGSRVGTPAYIAPEVILTTKGKTYDGKVADVWACGVMLYVMLVAKYPFRRTEDDALRPANKLHVMLQRILEVNYELPASLQVSAECRDLLSRILVAEPAKRISIAGIMQHPWYCQDLPEGVRAMNDQLVPPDVGQQETHFPGQQSLKEIDRIVHETQADPNAFNGLDSSSSLDLDGYDVYLDADTY